MDKHGVVVRFKTYAGEYWMEAYDERNPSCVWESGPHDLPRSNGPSMLENAVQFGEVCCDGHQDRVWIRIEFPDGWHE